MILDDGDTIREIAVNKVGLATDSQLFLILINYIKSQKNETDNDKQKIIDSDTVFMIDAVREAKQASIKDPYSSKNIFLNYNVFKANENPYIQKLANIINQDKQIIDALDQTVRFYRTPRIGIIDDEDRDWVKSKINEMTNGQSNGIEAILAQLTAFKNKVKVSDTDKNLAAIRLRAIENQQIRKLLSEKYDFITMQNFISKILFIRQYNPEAFSSYKELTEALEDNSNILTDEIISAINEQLSDIDILSNKIGDISDTEFEKILKKNITLIKMSKSDRRTINHALIDVNGSSNDQKEKILNQFLDIKDKFTNINEFKELKGIDQKLIDLIENPDFQSNIDHRIKTIEGPSVPNIIILPASRISSVYDELLDWDEPPLTFSIQNNEQIVQIFYDFFYRFQPVLPTQQKLSIPEMFSEFGGIYFRSKDQPKNIMDMLMMANDVISFPNLGNKLKYRTEKAFPRFEYLVAIDTLKVYINIISDLIISSNDLESSIFQPRHISEVFLTSPFWKLWSIKNQFKLKRDGFIGEKIKTELDFANAINNYPYPIKTVQYIEGKMVDVNKLPLQWGLKATTGTRSSYHLSLKLYLKALLDNFYLLRNGNFGLGTVHIHPYSKVSEGELKTLETIKKNFGISMNISDLRTIPSEYDYQTIIKSQGFHNDLMNLFDINKLGINLKPTEEVYQTIISLDENVKINKVRHYDYQKIPEEKRIRLMAINEEIFKLIPKLTEHNLNDYYDLIAEHYVILYTKAMSEEFGDYVGDHAMNPFTVGISETNEIFLKPSLRETSHNDLLELAEQSYNKQQWEGAEALL